MYNLLNLNLEGDYMLHHAHVERWIKPLAWFSILVCIITWTLELSGLVHACPYCQVQRTTIGLVGVILLLPYRNLLTDYLTLVFAVFGTSVATTQMFNNFYKSAYHEEYIYLSTCAFLIFMAQLLVTFTRKR